MLPAAEGALQVYSGFFAEPMLARQGGSNVNSLCHVCSTRLAMQFEGSDKQFCTTVSEKVASTRDWVS